MATIPVTPSVVQDIVDNADERELWIVGREFERPPYFHAGKGGRYPAGPCPARVHRESHHAQ